MRDLHRALWAAQGDARGLAGTLYDASEEIRCATDEAACRERVTELVARSERQLDRLRVAMARVLKVAGFTAATEHVGQCQMCHGTGDDVTVDAPHPHPQPACPQCDGSGEVLIVTAPYRDGDAHTARRTSEPTP